MELFHDKMSALKQFYCINCNQLWPSENQKCSNCKKHCSKFTTSNDMNPEHDHLPSHIKKLFEELSMIEEMLISPILTIMSIFRLPGGQLVSRCYVSNFSQDIAPLYHVKQVKFHY